MIALNIICWNCKGVNNINTFNRIWKIMKTHNPCIFYLVETKDCKNRISNVCHKFKSNWDWIAIPSIGYSGHIICSIEGCVVS